MKEETSMNIWKESLRIEIVGHILYCQNNLEAKHKQPESWNFVRTIRFPALKNEISQGDLLFKTQLSIGGDIIILKQKA